jgi:NAD(P)-dependent dehydrogenase (short-subunit alcohol dehydrogenase family)
MAEDQANQEAAEPAKSDGSAVWRLLALEPDCVLTELTLSDLDGLWLVDALRTQPTQVAQMIAFLASPAGDFVTGTTVVIDGGVDNVDLPPGRGS